VEEHRLCLLSRIFENKEKYDLGTDDWKIFVIYVFYKVCSTDGQNARFIQNFYGTPYRRDQLEGCTHDDNMANTDI
jgi:hypothetical protein